MKVKVVGPNLPAEAGESFHVHAADCADLKRGWIRRHAAEEPTVDLDSREEVVLYVYDNGIMDENPDLTWRDYLGEFRFLPCVAGLPEEVANEG